ncbi:MAG: hypothetical protein K0R15_642 [Clostridiales bacterium]|jgi:hypothetical protein|nr:hypothetical protein [Clostridiales bacterium]
MKKKYMEIVGENSIYNAGVYQFETKLEGKVLYVGSAIDIGNSCLSRHLYNLRRGLYMENNKRPIQEAWDRDDLCMRVIFVSASTNDVKDMTTEEKESLQIALSLIEEVNINLNRLTVCNSHFKVSKHSSNKKDDTTSSLRHDINLGSLNPNVKYDETIIANILYLKEQGLKPKQIIELLLQQDIDVNTGYISQLGVFKWCHLESIKPDWYKGA